MPCKTCKRWDIERARGLRGAFVNRDVCEHFAPADLPCARREIDPKSLAGILLREHDSAEQAARYAARKARLLELMGNAVGCDYHEAAEILSRFA